ncbi:MAG: phosphatase PAP2 family protein [Clostridia bacterium]|nr:phosphatase PAP2 family protein [Clostridia bacterium]
MNKKIQRKWLAAGILFALFLLLILLVKVADVAAVGPNKTSIGLSHLNKAFFSFTGVQVFWYILTEIIGVLALILAGFLALAGLFQWIRRKSLFKVDREILCVGGLYAVVLLTYAFFEKVIVNFRPVLMTGETEPEASFPSSHTVLIIAVVGSLIMILNKYVADGKLRRILRLAFILLIFVTVLGRLLSGVHWLTDIIGAVLISSAYLTAFSAVLDRVLTTRRHR